MRVLMISKACLVGTYQTKLEALARQPDVELAVIVPASWNDPAGRIELELAHTEGYQLWVDPLRFNGRYHFYSFPTLRRRLKEFDPHILHIDEEPYNLASYLALRQARRQGVRALFFTWQNLYRSYPPPFRWLENWVLAHADFAIMGNQAAVDVFTRKGYRGPHRVIPQFGVDADLFPFRGASPGQTERPDKTIGFAGRLIHGKGVDLLLKAMAIVKNELAEENQPFNWQAVIAGNGPALPELERLTGDLGLGERVRFIGGIRSAEMPAFLQKLDLLVLPSRTLSNWQEQFGRILIEAMASGVPVLGSDSGEIPHVIGDAGLIFPEGDFEALAAQIRHVLGDSTQTQMLAAAGRERVIQRFTQEQVAVETAAIYQEMMEN
ncbi:MAG: glycosyltransferase family 4 protein [Ardenticatenaceae bacterium]|nr:glycosyltransferase family 4 protein [Ardenticatenaceae bacterium]